MPELKVSNTGELAPPQKLPPHTHITHPLAYVEGWYAYYMNADERKVIALPVVGWAVCTYRLSKDGQKWSEEFRPFVATLMGQLVDYMEIPFALICVLGPAVKDHPAAVKAQLLAADIDIESIAAN